MSYVLNKLTNVFKLDTLMCIFKFGFDIKKMFSLLLILTVLYIIVGPTYKFMKYLFVPNNNSNKTHHKTNQQTNQQTNGKKFRPITSESSCSACYPKSSKSSKSYKSSKSSKSHKSSSTHIDKKEVAKVLRTFKIIV